MSSESCIRCITRLKILRTVSLDASSGMSKFESCECAEQFNNERPLTPQLPHSPLYLNASWLSRIAELRSSCKTCRRSHIRDSVPWRPISMPPDMDSYSSCIPHCGFCTDLQQMEWQQISGIIKRPNTIAHLQELNLRAHSKWCWWRYVLLSLPHTAYLSRTLLGARFSVFVKYLILWQLLCTGQPHFPPRFSMTPEGWFLKI